MAKRVAVGILPHPHPDAAAPGSLELVERRTTEAGSRMPDGRPVAGARLPAPVGRIGRPVSEILFWGLDGYFLWQERLFRALYDHVRQLPESEIGRALQRCDWFILVLSPESVASQWVKRELVYALRQERFDGRIAPLLYRACDAEQLSWTLPRLQGIDFTGSFDDGCRELLRIWNLQYAPVA